MLKRSLAVILALVLVLSCCAVSVGAVDYQPVDSYTVNEDTPYTEEAIIACGGSLEDTQTIYFQAPEDWANRFNTFDGPDDSEPYMHVCIYWWEGIGSKWPDGTGVQWVGYQTHLIDKENRIYSATVPDDVTSKVIWNNGVNGGMDPYAPVFNYSRQMADANIQGAAAGDFDTLPEGSPAEDNMDQCIQIINYDPELAQENPLTGIWNYGSDWYVYYGDGCYGYYPTYSENYDGQAENCVNPEHFDSNGNHVGFVPSTDGQPLDPNDIPDVSGDRIYFYAPSAGWENASYILFYIYEIGGESLGDWGSKKLSGTNEGNGVWSYDAAAKGVEPGKCYGLILYNFDTGAETYDLLLDTSCFGDIAYADLSTRIENPADSNKSRIKTRWKNSTTCGPRLQITSIGNVIGETVPDNMTVYQMFVDFLASKGSIGLQNALNYNGRDAQTTIDYVASALGLTQEDVTLAIRDAATVGDPYGDKTDWSREWSAERSYLPSEDPRYNNDYYRFYQYLTEELPELRKTSIKPDQYLVDDEARDRGLKKADVQYVFDKYYVEGIEWEPENCKLESGYHYQEGGYYLFSTDEDSEYNIRHIPGYYAFGLDRLTGYYTLDLSNVNVGARLDAVKPLEHVAVAEYSDGVFRKVSGDLTSADAKLYFFRPQEDGYGFGYNTAAELPDGSSSSSSGSSSGSTYPLKTPEIKSITSTVDGLKVTWDAVSGAQKYRLYVRGADGWDRISEQTGTSYTYSNVTSGNAVNFTVRCVSSDGNTFMSDYNRYGWNGRYLDAPKITSLDSSKEGVEISWDPVPGNAMYRVYVKYLDSWKALGDTYSTSFLHSSRGDGSIYAQPETEYTYTVRCLSYNGKVLTSDYDHEGKTIFFDPPFDLRGDADGNGEIEAIDVTIIQRYADWMINFTYEDMARADVDGDAWADITDATAIQYYLAGLSTPYPVGERYYS